jgi:general secretion pathway protein I
LSHAVASQTHRTTAGFTIIEALVALAVVTISVAAIGSLMGAASRGTRQLEQHVAMVQAAYNALWSSFPPRSVPLSSGLSGRSMEAVWRADAEPFAIDLGAPTGEVPWVPQKIRLRVQSASGAMIDLETIRLFKRRTE